MFSPSLLSEHITYYYILVELEDFLIRNREEYLSFSAKNYTIEQRDYNNRLTSQLLDHANESGYPDLFEECPFSAVRDRIRSYYKSYVQSFKRRRERQQKRKDRYEKEDTWKFNSDNTTVEHSEL